MNPLAFLTLFAAVAVASASTVDVNALGPVRSCRCYTSSAGRSVQPPPGLSTEMKSLGPAEVCHCMPSMKAPLVNPPVAAHLNTGMGMGMGMSMSMNMPSSLLGSVKATESCYIGHSIDGKYTVDDNAELKMCNEHLSYGSINQLININLVNSQYKCGDFFFSLKNIEMSSGLAFGFTAYGVKYVAVGSGSPPLPDGVKPLKAYAKWTYGSCEGVTVDSEAVYVSFLVGSNDAFKTMATDYSAYPIGVQDGFVYPYGLQCVRIENPWCVSK